MTIGEVPMACGCNLAPQAEHHRQWSLLSTSLSARPPAQAHTSIGIDYPCEFSESGMNDGDASGRMKMRNWEERLAPRSVPHSQKQTSPGEERRRISHQPTSHEGIGPNRSARKSISTRTRDESMRLGK